MTKEIPSQDVHLVGSVPLQSSEEVFKTTASILGTHITRIPDGETGERSNWVDWQFPLLEANSHLEEIANDVYDYTQIRMLGLSSGSSIDDLDIDNLGYADAALESWAKFEALTSSGEIPAGYRFQVSLPTPLATPHLYVHPSIQADFEKKYERQMLNELKRIVAEIPGDRLAIQWDTAVEFALLEGIMPTYMEDPLCGITERLLRLCGVVPEPVELGFHFCYGDSQHKHFCEPADMGKLVDLANRIARGAGRSLQWIHMPVPRERFDAEYYKPLADLDLAKDTKLFLGLVHQSDGEEGSKKRISAAKEFYPEFGIATECGFGRRPSDTVPPLMELHTRLSAGT